LVTTEGPARPARGSRATRVGGSVAPGFEAVRAAFAQGQRDDEGAAQLCVYQDGVPVVDLWAGTDPVHGRPVDGQSLSILMSVTKGVVATCAHLLAQRGLLDLDAPVATYWPDFAANGKERIKVSDLLAHRSGLATFPPDADIDSRRLLDWDRCVQSLADMAPLWEPGTARLYHTLTYGYLVGEVIRRITGHSVGTLLATQIARPLGLDLWIGLPEAMEARVLPQFTRNPRPTRQQFDQMLSGLGLDPADPLVHATMASVSAVADTVEGFNERAAHAAQIPAANGVGNARSLARLYAAVIGNVDGTRLLDPDTLERATTPQGDHLPLPGPLQRMHGADQSRHGLGYELPNPNLPMLGTGSFGHAGAGGRLAFAQPRTRIAVAYTCTNMAWQPATGADTRWQPWTTALRDCVGLNSPA
jgi:CubicO group peptidase (beta-lactamase class C family)